MAADIQPGEMIGIDIGQVNRESVRAVLVQRIFRQDEVLWYEYWQHGLGASLVVKADDPIVDNTILSGKARATYEAQKAA